MAKSLLPRAGDSAHTCTFSDLGVTQQESSLAPFFTLLTLLPVFVVGFTLLQDPSRGRKTVSSDSSSYLSLDGNTLRF